MESAKNRETVPENPVLTPRWAIAAALAWTGALNPLPVPLTGLHKFYVGQPLWGSVYLLLGWTQIPRIACVLEGVWYVLRREAALPSNGGQTPGIERPPDLQTAEQTQAIAIAIRELEQLRQEGLVTELEFEQKRRHLLAKLG